MEQRSRDGTGDDELDAPSQLRDDESEASQGGLHPAYFGIRFRREGETAPEWPKEFVIITAYATTGERWSDDKNTAASAALYEKLVLRELWIEPLTGYDPESGHAEPGYAVVLPMEEARELGRRFRQDAIFHVLGDALSVTRCEGGSPLVLVGRFRERLVLGGAPPAPTAGPRT